MSAIKLSFNEKPGIAGPMFKALFTSRKGFNASVGLPAIEARWQSAKADPQALDKYLTTLNIQPSNHLPVLYPHVMAGAMHMHMLTHKAFPIKLLGALHLKNQIQQLKSIPVDSEFDIESQLGGFRLVEKGVEFDFYTQVVSNGETVWKETSIYFMAGRFGGKENPSKETSFELSSISDGEQGANWFVPADRGKVYAKITGDYNPIHTSKQLAKLFGFKRDIAHGFGVLAQAIEQTIENREGALSVDVIFKGPVFLESDVKVSKQGSTGRFDIYCGENDRSSICAEVK